ncbi:MAG: adenosylcobinamide-phosphate synthase CbiB [Pseudomonadota bacterium]
MNASLVLAGALALDALLGEPKWLWNRLPHPAVLMGRLIGWCDRRFNRGKARRAKGLAVLLALIAFGVVLGLLLARLGAVAEICVAAVLLAQKSLVQHVGAVAQGLRMSLQAGRDAVAMIVSRDTGQMEESAVARSAIESAAENLSDGVIAPAFWFVLAGLPGLLVYKLVNTADSMIGYRTVRYEAFGWAAARTDDVLNLLPARGTAALIAIVSGLRIDAKLRSDARLHRSPNAGWPEAAMASALGIALSGPRAYDGEMREFAWVNAGGRRHPTPVDIDDSIAVLWRVWSIVLLASAAIGLMLEF